MDVEEKDSRLEELKKALEHLPVDTAKVESTAITDWPSITSYSFNQLGNDAIPALTALDLSALTAADIQIWAGSNTAPFSNSAVTMAGTGGSGTFTVTTGGGGGGSGGAGYGQAVPGTTTGTGHTYLNGTNAGWAKPYNTGKTKISADEIEIQGKSLLTTLERIEQRLGILDCDENLEAHWDKLKALGDEYRKMKQYIEDKVKTFETLKKMPKPESE